MTKREIQRDKHGRRIIWSSADGRLYMTSGRRTKAEENELYARMDGIVGFTSRSAGSRATLGGSQPAAYGNVAPLSETPDLSNTDGAGGLNGTP